MPPIAGGAARRARGRLHRAVDERVADRGVHPDPADGRHRRAPVPRVRGHAVGGDPGLAGGLAHHHADDVRARCCRPQPSASAAASTAERARLRRDARAATSEPRLGAAHTRSSCCSCCSRRSRLNVYLYIDRAEGLLPAAGHRPARSGFIQADQSISFQAMRAKLAELRRHRAARSGGRERGRLHRRRAAQHAARCSSR